MEVEQMFKPGSGKDIDTEKWCYHYTRLSTFMDDIHPKQTIMFSPLKNVDDPKESGMFGKLHSSRPSDIPTGEVEKYIDLDDKVENIFRERVKIFCVTKDRTKVQTNFDRGHYRPRMWAQYGDRCKGVCLVNYTKDSLNI